MGLLLVVGCAFAGTVVAKAWPVPPPHGSHNTNPQVANSPQAEHKRP